MNHDEIYKDPWENKEQEWIPYPKNDVLSTVFCYTQYSKTVEEITGFGMKNSSTLPSLKNKYFNSLRDENNETVSTYNDGFMRWFV